ncbi:hypothetical protein M2390_000508 [Mycetocola sp. BIGb0189]|uniref:hypothetical protein n=1 Tax=Mycetocola sp. BIGb0189 TaxID=2940604 RepID=UPI002169ED8B|nr:hypothetical protein [Mycetocola sp. BIGb0189]MCS4275347.1 hypothetical protein [Mycetocola sp. BIGb0189]
MANRIEFLGNIRGPAGYNALGADQSDKTVAGYVNQESGATQTRAALRQHFVPQSAYRFNNGTTPLVDLIDNTGSASTIHLTSGPGFKGAYLMGIGNDYEDKPGLLIANKAKGVGFYLDNYPSATNSAFFGAQNGGGSAFMDLFQNADNAEPVLRVRANPAIKTKWAQSVFAAEDKLGSAFRVLTEGGIWAQRLVTVAPENGSDVAAQVLVTGAPGVGSSQRSGTYHTINGETYLSATGQESKWFATRVWSTSDKLSFQGGGIRGDFGSNEGGAWTTALQINVHGQLGFFGAAPVSRVPVTPGWANDLSTTIAQVNAIKGALINLGLISS